MINSVPDNQEQFWQEVEASLQCPVFAYGLAQYNPSDTCGKKNAVWGLIYISEKGLHFYHFPQQSWMSALMEAKPTEQTSINLLFSHIRSWRPPIYAGFFQSLIGRGDPRLLIQGAHTDIPMFNTHTPSRAEQQQTTSSAPERVHSFTLDMRKTALLAALQTHIADKQVSML